MILEKQSETVILEEGEIQESTNMVIDADSHIFLMRMLSKFYADSIGSLIRETASNALDSHRECGVTDPIVVGFKQNKDGNYEFSVEDFGCGMDDQDVENVIKKYGKSTKRQSANQLGAFGLGFKSPLAYTSAFYFIGRKGGIERKWMLYEADDEQNKIDLLHQTETKERNGVKIIVPVQWKDRNSFIHKIKEQLAYFESVYFDCAEVQNDFTIIRHQDFQWSPLCDSYSVHICLDNVYYPIDYTKLGISPISFPVGLRFSLSDGIFPVPNREMIKYTQEAKDIILKKIATVSDYFIGKYNESVKDSDNVEAVFNYFRRTSRFVKSYDGIKDWDVNVLLPFSSLKLASPKLKGVDLLDLQRLFHMKDALLLEYDKKYQVKRYNTRFKSLDNSNWYRTFSYDDCNGHGIYTFTDIKKQQKDYIRDTTNTDLYFVRKERTLILGKKDGYTVRKPADYISILQLPKFPKSEWRQRIKEFQYVQGLISSKFTDLDKLVIPQAWIDGKKKTKLQTAPLTPKTRRKKLVGEVTGKMATQLYRYVSGQNCKFETTVFQMKDAHKHSVFTVYGGTDLSSTFDKWFTLFKKEKVRFVMFSERELKRLKDVELHNWMSMEEFSKGKHKLFRRAVTAYLIDVLEDQFPNVFSKAHIIEKISTPLYDNLIKLKEYKKEHFLDGDVELYKAIAEVALEGNLYDSKTYSIYKEVKFMLEKLTFLNPLLKFGYYETPDDSTISALRDLFKYYKQRMDWQHYVLPIDEKLEVVN